MPKAFVLLEDARTVNAPPRIVGERDVVVGEIIVLDELLGKRARVTRIQSYANGEIPFAFVRMIA